MSCLVYLGRGFPGRRRRTAPAFSNSGCEFARDRNYLCGPFSMPLYARPKRRAKLRPEKFGMHYPDGSGCFGIKAAQFKNKTQRRGERREAIRRRDSVRSGNAGHFRKMQRPAPSEKGTCCDSSRKLSVNRPVDRCMVRLYSTVLSVEF